MFEKFNKIFGRNSNGIIEIDSGINGKTFTIVACTHGNEISGLHVIDYLINDFKITNKLKKGKIIFVIGNIEGLKLNKRYIDFDLNRVWGLEKKYKGSYEYKRAIELVPILEKSDILLDIHSTSLNSQPFFVVGSDYIEKDLLKYLKVDFSIEKIGDFLNGKFLAKYMAEHKKGNFSFVLESGSHLSKKTIDLSIENTLNTLKYFNFIDGNPTIEKKYNTYIVKECIKSKTLNVKYLYSNNPKSFDKISKHQKILADGNLEIISKSDYIILMPSYPLYKGEEICYLMKQKI